VADGDTLTVAAQAVPSGNVTVRWIVIRTTGALTITDSVPLHGAGPQSVTRHYAVPLQTPPGGVNVTATAHDGGVIDSGATTVFVLPYAYSSMSAGGYHTCALTPVSTPYCWGANGAWQLGDSGTTSSATPVAVAGGLTFTSISTGGAHSCGLTAAGSAYCWGFNNSGQLGDSTIMDRSTPVAVKGAFTFTSLATGGLHSCGLTTTGAVYCWGANGAYQLGDGTQLSHPTPAAVQTTVSFASLGSSVGSHTCGLTGSGLGYCWGDDLFGQIGDGATFSSAPTPHAIAGAQAFAAVSGGSDHSCGVSPAHVAYCWGYNGNGQLGTGSVGG